MTKLKLTPSAEWDLTDIWLYIAQDSPVYADKFIQKVLVKCQLFADNPNMGVKRDDIAAGLLAFPSTGISFSIAP